MLRWTWKLHILHNASFYLLFLILASHTMASEKTSFCPRAHHTQQCLVPISFLRNLCTLWSHNSLRIVQKAAEQKTLQQICGNILLIRFFRFFCAVINYSASSSMLKCPHPLCMENHTSHIQPVLNFIFKAEKCRSGDLSLFFSFSNSFDDSYRAGEGLWRERLETLITCGGGLECDYSGPSWEFLTLCFTKSFVLYHWNRDGVKEKSGQRQTALWCLCLPRNMWTFIHSRFACDPQICVSE